MKARRILLALLGGICLFMGLVTGERLYYIVVCALALAALLSLGAALWGMIALRYRQYIREPGVHKGETLTMCFEMQNATPLPLSRVELVYHTLQSRIEGAPLTRQIWLGALSSLTEEVPFEASYWGRYTVGLEAIRLSCPLGLFVLTLNLNKLAYHKPLRLLIYPRTLMPKTMDLPVQLIEGQNQQRGHTVQHSAQIDHMRRYVRGDSLRRVHWKLTARTRKVLVKVYEDSSKPRLLLVIDCRRHDMTGLDAIRVEDGMIESAAAVANYTLSHGLPLRMVAYPQQPVRLQADSSAHIPAFHESIARLSFDGDFAMRDILRIEPYDHALGLLVIVHDIPPALFDELITQKMKGMQVMALCVALSAQDARLQKAVAELRNRGVRAGILSTGGDVIKAVSDL